MKITVVKTFDNTTIDRQTRKYVSVPADLLRELPKTLKKRSSILLWLYFMSNQKDYKLCKDVQEIYKELELSYDAFRDAMNELLEKGYLIKTDKNHYILIDPKDLEI